jgi:hypothetical protein
MQLRKLHQSRSAVLLQACQERADELAVQLPKLQAEAAKVEQDMAAAQQQSEDAEITDEGREALLERIQTLTTTQSEAQQRLSDAEQVLDQLPSNTCHSTCSDALITSFQSTFTVLIVVVIYSVLYSVCFRYAKGCGRG